FKLFHTNAGGENNLSIDFIFSLAMDAQDNLWVGGQNGLYRFDAQQEKLVRFADTLKDVSNLVMDKQGTLWFTTGWQLYRYDIRRNKLNKLPSALSNVAAICQLTDGRMCVATANGFISFLQPDSTTLISTHDVFAHSPAPASRWISKLVPGNKANIYIGTSSQGLKEFNLTTQTYEDLLTANTDKTTVYVRDIIPFKQNEFWLATESGIFILNTDTKAFTNLRKKYLDPYSLSDNAIYTLFKDREEGMWAGTFFGGLNYYPKQNLSFQKYFPDYSENSITGSAVREICADGKGALWIGTEDAGLNKLDLKTGAISRFYPNGSSGSIDYSNIHGLLADGNRLWIGTFEHGLNIMDIASGRVIERYRAGPNTFDLKSNFIVTILKTRNGDIYLGTSNSLAKWTGHTGKFLAVQNASGDAFVSALLEDHEGTVWIGTHNRGLSYFNPATGAHGRLLNKPADKNSLTTNSINALYEDGNGLLWLAMEGGGLCQLSKNRKVVRRFTTENGLPSNVVFKVLEDDQENLWVTTSKGLVKLNTARSVTTVYTKENGLLNDQFNYNSGYKDLEGRLYFGSVRGMITFRPHETHRSNFVPPVYITGLQIHNREIEVNTDTALLKKSIVYTDNITLNHNESSISVDFAALSFSSPEVTTYSYFMEGLDKDWTHLKSNRKVYFTNLQPGTYTFKVKASANGIWNKRETRLTIHITPPWWATWWAISIYVLLAAVLLSYFIRMYHKMVMSKKEKDIYEAKIEFFTNIAHEIKTPLTLIKGPVENLSEMTAELPEIQEDVATMNRNTTRLVNLVNQILDFRQTETKGFSLDFTPVLLNEVLQEAFVTFKPLAKKRNLQYNIELPSSKVFTLADGEALTKVFSNLFSNAVKYAEQEVHIKLLAPEKGDKFLQIEVSNDGLLIPIELKEKIFEPFYRLKQTAKLKGTGIGLALARSLTELHQGQLFVNHATEGMNTFVLRLPYSPVREPAITAKRLQS
ncbi:MAG TPA: two-component regulator propeller domain-containing protein, partial [Flavisolibacter sp.]|nr:two-component regulator propeller domain-containing protein [Flavisolibacter sp.]